MPRLLTLREVTAATALSRSAVYAMMAESRFTEADPHREPGGSVGRAGSARLDRQPAPRRLRTAVRVARTVPDQVCVGTASTRFGQGLADATRAVVTMDPKARDRRIRGLGSEPVGGVPPVSVTWAKPTPALAAELGPTPTTAAMLAAFRVLDTGVRGGNRGGG